MEDLAAAAEASSAAIMQNADTEIEAVNRRMDAADSAFQEELDMHERLRDEQMARYEEELAHVERMQGFAKDLRGFVDDLMLSDVSPLTNQQRFEEAQKQYQQTLTAAQRGDESAIVELKGASQAYLKEARNFYASSQDYTDIFSAVTGDVGAMAGQLEAVQAANAPLSNEVFQQGVAEITARHDTEIATLEKEIDQINQSALEQMRSVDATMGRVEAGITSDFNTDMSALGEKMKSAQAKAAADINAGTNVSYTKLAASTKAGTDLIATTTYNIGQGQIETMAYGDSSLLGGIASTAARIAEQTGITIGGNNSLLNELQNNTNAIYNTAYTGADIKSYVDTAIAKGDSVEDIYNVAVQEGVSAKQIADAYGVAESDINRILDDAGLPRLASGAIAKGSTLAEIGEGIHPEMVVPLPPSGISVDFAPLMTELKALRAANDENTAIIAAILESIRKTGSADSAQVQEAIERGMRDTRQAAASGVRR